VVMQFTLAYGGEHYVVDGIAGALCAWGVHALATRLEAVQRPKWVQRREAGQHSDGVPDAAG
jgi:membrane-associated phospholipid phosphatase